MEKYKPLLKELLDYLITIVVTFLVVFIIATYIFKPVEVDGTSMYPTLLDGDRGFTSLISLKLKGINRFDIVTAYLEEKDELIIKRVIGLPGDKIEFRNDDLYINDELYDEFYLDQNYRIDRKDSANNHLFTDNYGPLTLNDDEYFLVGDNRPDSADSRVFGVFSSKEIKSIGMFVFWPFHNFGIKK